MNFLAVSTVMRRHCSVVLIRLHVGDRTTMGTWCGALTCEKRGCQSRRSLYGCNSPIVCSGDGVTGFTTPGFTTPVGHIDTPDSQTASAIATAIGFLPTSGRARW